jgi:hypothetical protein
MRRTVFPIAVAGLLLVSLAPETAQAQEPPPPPPDSVELVFEREIFVYPSYARQDPFQNLLDMDESGPRFEDLVLLGIVYSDDPNLSVALFGGAEVEMTDPETEGAGQPAEMTSPPEQGAEAVQGRTTTGAGRTVTYRARRGQRLGNMRVIEIQPTRVIVDVTEFGVTEQHVFELQRGSGGNGP